MRSKSIFVFVTIVLLFSSKSNSFAATASFQGLGDLPGGGFYSQAYAVSADGSTVVGHSKTANGLQAFRWTQASGMEYLGDLPNGHLKSIAYDVSADGSVIIGSAVVNEIGLREAFRWTAEDGMVGLGYISGGSYSRGFGVSNDGTVVVGWGNDGYDRQRAFRCTETAGMHDLGALFYSSYAYGVSSDGSVVVGESSGEAFRWTQSTGMQGIGDLPGGDFYSYAHNVSGDGLVVVGFGNSPSGYEAFRWTELGGMDGLGDLLGGNFYSSAWAASVDGSVIVGHSDTGLGGGTYEAFIWDEQNGMRNLKEVLEGSYGLDLTGWTLYGATGISEDGLTIVGHGRNPGGSQEAWLAQIPEPSTPPVADADGPYSIYVGDTLTLDASGSTDDDNDIVSFIWDLDDDENFETDADGQAILVLDYSYLQSLGLLINYTYTIHLKVTDSKGQSDTAETTLTIIPKPALAVAVDIKPQSCPNPLNVKSSGVLPIAILGTDDYDITTIDPTSIRLAGVEPLRSGYEDVATPVSDTNDCNCITEGPDGFLDLTLKFETQAIVKAIGDVNDGDILELELTGVLYDPIPFETPIEGADCILIRGRHKPINPADINKDGVVNAADFAIIAENWLQSSIVWD